jgi:hypothetical protein
MCVCVCVRDYLRVRQELDGREAGGVVGAHRRQDAEELGLLRLGHTHVRVRAGGDGDGDGE